jgi:hypothetical protein
MSNLILIDPEAAATLDVDSNSTVLEGQATVVDEADALKAHLLVEMANKFKALAVVEASLAKGLMADAVQAVVNVIRLPNKPKYATIAGLIVKAMGREAYAQNQVKMPDETMEYRTGKQNVYRQYATPFVAMARWDAGMWTKPEIDHRDRNPALEVRIMYQGQSFTSPIEALRAGVPWSTCYRSFRNVIAPGWSDLSVLDTAKTEKLARDNAKNIAKPKLKITMLVHSEDGTPKRGQVPIKGHGALTTGTILGLLDGAKLSQSQCDKISAAIITALYVPTPKTV